MSRLECRSSIALAAVVAVLLSSRPADAQVYAQGSSRQQGGSQNALGTTSFWEQANQAKALRRLPKAHEKLNRDVARNDMVAVDRDTRQIINLEYRVAVDEWLIRKMSCQDNPGCYPYPRSLDPVTFCAIGQYRYPPRPRDLR